MDAEEQRNQGEVQNQPARTVSIQADEFILGFHNDGNRWLLG